MARRRPAPSPVYVFVSLQFHYSPICIHFFPFYIYLGGTHLLTYVFCIYLLMYTPLTYTECFTLARPYLALLSWRCIRILTFMIPKGGWRKRLVEPVLKAVGAAIPWHGAGAAVSAGAPPAASAMQAKPPAVAPPPRASFAMQARPPAVAPPPRASFPIVIPRAFMGKAAPAAPPAPAPAAPLVPAPPPRPPPGALLAPWRSGKASSSYKYLARHGLARDVHG